MDDIQAYKKRRSNSPIALRNEIILIRHCLKIARSEWGLDFPTVGWEVTSLPKKPTSRKRRVSDEEYKALYETSKTLRQHYIWPAVSLAIETGMRRGELLKLESSGLNEGSRTEIVSFFWSELFSFNMLIESFAGKSKINCQKIPRVASWFIPIVLGPGATSEEHLRIAKAR